MDFDPLSSTPTVDEWGPNFRAHFGLPARPSSSRKIRDLWDAETQARFARYLYVGRFEHAEALRVRTRRVAAVKQIMDGFLNMPSMLSGIYWTEFLRTRADFFRTYDAAVSEHANNALRAPKQIYERLAVTLPSELFDRQQARRDLASAVERVVEVSVCALCYERPKDACLLHDDGRGCMLCRACARRVDMGAAPCPFCRAPVVRTARLT